MNLSIERSHGPSKFVISVVRLSCKIFFTIFLSVAIDAWVDYSGATMFVMRTLRKVSSRKALEA
jgi:hypothetical protein